MEIKEKPKVFKWFWMGFLIVWMVNQHTNTHTVKKRQNM